MSTRLIARLAGGIGFRSQPSIAVPAPSAVQDIADRLARVHDYLLGRVATLDDEPEDVPEPEHLPRSADASIRGEARMLGQAA